LLAVAEVVEDVIRGADVGKNDRKAKHEGVGEMIQSRL
jgi:hypothetical protein